MKGITGNPVLDAYHRMAVNPVGAARPVEPKEAAASTTTPTGGAAAEVKISSRAYDLATEGGQSVVDAQKVESLKKQVSEGSFKINSELIAQKMVALG